MSFGKGAIQSVLCQQKIKTRSSVEAELVPCDDISAKMMRTKQFLETQGFEVTENVVFRDNQSSIELVTNGKEWTFQYQVLPYHRSDRQE